MLARAAPGRLHTRAGGGRVWYDPRLARRFEPRRPAEQETKVHDRDRRHPDRAAEGLPLGRARPDQPGHVRELLRLRLHQPPGRLLKAQLGFSDANIGLLNAIYSFPNIVMLLIGGIVIDRIGTGGHAIFGVLCFAGAALTALSGSLAVMAAGRLVFGLGAESLIVAVTTAIAKWFRGKELSFAFGVNLTIARLGSFAALNSPSWAAPAYERWQWPLSHRAWASPLSASPGPCSTGSWRSGRRRFTTPALRARTRSSGRTSSASAPRSGWVVALCITFYSAIFPFQTFAVKFFMEAHGTGRETGGFLSSLLTLFAMIFTPLFGLLVDKVGKRAIFMMFGSLLLMPVYLMMAYTRMPALVLFEARLPFVEMAFPVYLPIVMMGIAFSLIPAVMWPSVAYLVDQSKLGTAYGLMTMIQNVGLFGFNILIGWSNDHWQGYGREPRGLHAGDVDVLGARLRGASLRLAPPAAGRRGPTPTGWRRSPPRPRAAERRSSSLARGRCPPSRPGPAARAFDIPPPALSFRGTPACHSEGPRLVIPRDLDEGREPRLLGMTGCVFVIPRDPGWTGPEESAVSAPAPAEGGVLVARRGRSSSE